MILSHELFKFLHRTWRTKSLSCLFYKICISSYSRPLNKQTNKQKKRYSLEFFCETCWIVNHDLFVQFGMKGEMLCELVLSGQELMTNSLRVKVEKKRALGDQKNEILKN